MVARFKHSDHEQFSMFEDEVSASFRATEMFSWGERYILVKLSERTFSVGDHLVVPVRQQIRAESINLMTIPQLLPPAWT